MIGTIITAALVGLICWGVLTVALSRAAKKSQLTADDHRKVLVVFAYFATARAVAEGRTPPDYSDEEGRSGKALALEDALNIMAIGRRLSPKEKEDGCARIKEMLIVKNKAYHADNVVCAVCGCWRNVGYAYCGSCGGTAVMDAEAAERKRAHDRALDGRDFDRDGE